MQAVKFTNATSEDFTWGFDSVDYTFKAGESIFLEDFKAQHFAKHLADREMNRKHILTNNVLERQKLEGQFLGGEQVTPVEALNLNEQAKEVKKTKMVVSEFEDLKVVPKKKV